MFCTEEKELTLYLKEQNISISDVLINHCFCKNYDNCTLLIFHATSKETELNGVLACIAYKDSFYQIPSIDSALLASFGQTDFELDVENNSKKDIYKISLENLNEIRSFDDLIKIPFDYSVILPYTNYLNSYYYIVTKNRKKFLYGFGNKEICEISNKARIKIFPNGSDKIVLYRNSFKKIYSHDGKSIMLDV